MTRLVLAHVLLAIVLVSEGRHYHGLEPRILCSPLYDPLCPSFPHRPRPVLCYPGIDSLCLPRPSPRRMSLLDDMFEPRMSGRSVIIPCWRPEFKTSSYCGYVPPPSSHPYNKGWTYT